MKSKSLSIVVSKKDLDLVIGRASLAAMTEEGQNEFSRTNNETLGCIRISAENGKIVFESSVTRFSSRYVLSAEGGDASIVSDGETCIPAKELKAVASKIKSNRKISIVFIPTNNDTSLNMEMAEKSLLPDGVVEIGSISGSKVVSKTKIEAYPAFQFAAPKYPEISSMKVIAECKVGLIKKACAAIGFSVNTSSLNETYDKIAIFTDEDGIYFVGSDGVRCAIVHAMGDTFDKYLNVETPVPLLADALFMVPALASLPDDAPVFMGTDETEERLYICSEDTSYCINMVNEVIRAKYPKHKRISEMKTSVSILINRDEISETMDLLGVVNNDRGVYTFDADNEVIKLVGMGIGTVKETTGSIGYKMVSEARMQSPSISLNTKYLSEGIKRMSCENIKMSFSDDEKKVRIEDETEPKFLYFMQVMSTSEA